MERHLALNHSLSLKKMQFFYTSQFTAILSGKCPHDIQTQFFCFHGFDEGVYWLKWDILEVRDIFARAGSNAVSFVFLETEEFLTVATYRNLQNSRYLSTCWSLINETPQSLTQIPLQTFGVDNYTSIAWPILNILPCFLSVQVLFGC